jgi:hypothetical protein
MSRSEGFVYFGLQHTSAPGFSLERLGWFLEFKSFELLGRDVLRKSKAENLGRSFGRHAKFLLWRRVQNWTY